MSEIAVQAEGLGKVYHIAPGGRTAPYRTLQEDIVAWVRRSFRARQFGSRRETFWALRDISLEIKQGEVLGIIGRNGAGKSTLLKLMARITRPTTGYVDMYGRVGSLLEVGTGFHRELTGRENVFLNGAILGMGRREIQRRFDEIVEFAGIEQFLETPVKRYSSGMYMRLAFSVAAHLETEILLVDEVLAVGDAEFQKKSLGKMESVAQQGRTVLFVSHNMNAVERLCSSALLLDRGQIKHHDTDVTGVIKHYMTEGSSLSSASEWINSGIEFENPWFKPLRFGIYDVAGHPASMPLNNEMAGWIKIEGDIQQADAALTVGYAIYAEDGTLLYWSYQTDKEEAQWPRLHPGRCVLRSRLPARLLNEGFYQIELIGGLHFREWLFTPGISAPSIQIQIQGGLSESPYWMAKRPGLLAPVLEWELD